MPGLCSLARIGSQLTCLDLSGCGLLSEDALSQLLRRTGPGCGARLTVLKLRSCDRAVTDTLLASFLPRAHALARLDVAYCTALTDATAVLLATGRSRALRALRHVDLTGCRRLAPRGRARLRACALRGPPPLVRFTGLDDSDDELDGDGCPRTEPLRVLEATE